MVKSQNVFVPEIVCAAEPLKVTVPEAGVNVPLLDQLPATSTPLDPGAKVPAVNVKLPLMSRALCAVFVPVAPTVKAEK